MDDKKVYSDKGGHIIFCDGCGFSHRLDNRWSFNNDYEKPTFRPSLLVRYPYGENNEQRRCHSFITDGKIQYLNDCTHHLKGQTVELQKF